MGIVVLISNYNIPPKIINYFSIIQSAGFKPMNLWCHMLPVQLYYSSFCNISALKAGSVIIYYIAAFYRATEISLQLRKWEFN